MKHIKRLVLTRIRSTLGFLSCETPSQKPEELFADRASLPKALDEIANPKPRSAGSTLARGRVAVAVIDNGVDYTHPDLAPQIRFSPGANGGTGLDVMGNDSWPHPNLIQAQLFAFGAQKIEKNLILGAPDNPLDLIAATNKTFMASLLSRIAQDTALRSSLFRKIDEKNFNVFLGSSFLEDWDLESYQKKKNSMSSFPKVLRRKAPPRSKAGKSGGASFNWAGHRS